MKTALIACSIAALGLVACEQKAKHEETTSTTAAAAPAQPASPTDRSGTPSTNTNTNPNTETATNTAQPASDIPTEVDFEEEAEQSITSANLEKELATLDKEISAKETVTGVNPTGSTRIGSGTNTNTNTNTNTK